MIHPKRLPRVDRVRELLDYNSETGEFVWLVRRGPVAAGTIAGALWNGYRAIYVDNVRYAAHRLAWLYVTGEEPRVHIDHRDGNRDNNAFSNLREAKPGENHQNVALYKNNKVGLRGVSRRGSRFHATIKINKKKIHLGFYATPPEAHAAYLAAKAKFHIFQPIPRDLAS